MKKRPKENRKLGSQEDILGLLMESEQKVPQEVSNYFLDQENCEYLLEWLQSENLDDPATSRRSHGPNSDLPIERLEIASFDRKNPSHLMMMSSSNLQLTEMRRQAQQSHKNLMKNKMFHRLATARPHQRCQQMLRQESENLLNLDFGLQKNFSARTGLTVESAVT